MLGVLSLVNDMQHSIKIYKHAMHALCFFYPCFKLFQTDYYTLTYPKTKETKLKPRIKLNHSTHK